MYIVLTGIVVQALALWTLKNVASFTEELADCSGPVSFLEVVLCIFSVGLLWFGIVPLMIGMVVFYDGLIAFGLTDDMVLIFLTLNFVAIYMSLLKIYVL